MRGTAECDFSDFDANTFSEFPNLHHSLTELYLFNLNRVRAIGSNTFGCFRNLSSLELTNANLKEVKVDAFKGLNKLIYLALSNSRIECFEQETLDCLDNLSWLILRNNLLKSFPPGLFCNLNRLRSLDLTQNPLDLDEDTLLGLTSLKRISLENTPLGAVIDRPSPIITKHLKSLQQFTH